MINYERLRRSLKRLFVKEVPADETLDLWSEDQCRLDDARLVVLDLCKRYHCKGMDSTMNEIWRQIGGKIFDAQIDDREE